MLKFTKYGRKASTGSFAIHALQTANANATVPSLSDDSNSKKVPAKLPPDPELSSFRKIENDDSTGKEQTPMELLPRPEKGILVVSKQTEQMPTATSLQEKDNLDEVPIRLAPQRHLSFSKVPREELILLDSRFDRNPEGGMESPKKVKHVHFSASTLDAYEKKENERKMGPTISYKTRTSLNPVGKIKVPVYNDDYFPRIQRINVQHLMEPGKVKHSHSLKFKIFKI